MVPRERQSQIRSHLAPLGMTIDFISKTAELSQLALATPLSRRPAAGRAPGQRLVGLLGRNGSAQSAAGDSGVCATATFQFWSGVLEVGGYDVIVEPLTDDELQGAVLRAARSFGERRSHDSTRE